MFRCAGMLLWGGAAVCSAVSLQWMSATDPPPCTQQHHTVTLVHSCHSLPALRCAALPCLPAGAMVYGNGFFGVTEANYSVVVLHLLTCAIRQAKAS